MIHIPLRINFKFMTRGPAMVARLSIIDHSALSARRITNDSEVVWKASLDYHSDKWEAEAITVFFTGECM
jgi:hypothetical protein